ncbi:TetR family transcriptional regulator [Planctomonas psychrotolerans]|uniref:TetR family transcriptional regulator n=1 Tax=Planctomonas psychrotolerans TaxID=2528712 RepID=UPI001D0D35B4|nr:TetR family transcriptional regulator [Planctomonas psychrotolerans]
MRSVSPEDATTRSRIRDASVLLFGRVGFEKASIRAIAESAGVSPALVLHHFGSKERLRDECDRYIVDEVMGRNDELGHGDLAATMQRWLADIDTFRPSLDYLSRMITDGSEHGDRLFDQLVSRTESMLAAGAADGSMHESSDPRMTAVIVATHGLLPLIFERHIGRVLGESGGLTESAIRRMTLPTLELYTRGLYTSDAVLEAARTALARTMGAPSPEGEGR